MADNAPDAGAGPPQPTALMSSFFPSPPSYFASFTQANLDLARKLVGHPSYSLDEVRANKEDPEAWLMMQKTVLEELNVPEDEIERVKGVDLASLVTPPEVELIETDGHWMAFGQAWPIHEKLPSLEEMGVKQLYKTPTTWEDRRQALQALLHTVLHTYLRLLSILADGPPSLAAEQIAFQTGKQGQVIKVQADTAIEHIRLAAINIHHLCNEWRPVQARETLKMLMKEQIEARRRRTNEVKHACEEISQRLASLKTFDASAATQKDADLASATTSMDLDARDKRQSDASRKPASSVKEKARSRMLQRLKELEEP